MLETFFEYIHQRFPDIIVFFIIAWISWKARGLYYRYASVEKKVGDLPCEMRKSEIDSIKSNSKKLDDINESIKKIEEWIIKKKCQQI